MVAAGKGADVHQKDSDGWTALHFCCRWALLSPEFNQANACTTAALHRGAHDPNKF